MKPRTAALATLLLLHATVAAAHEATPGRHAKSPVDRIPIVVDTDMGLDDVAALAALAAAPTVRLLAVTTVGGAARARPAARNAARLLALLGQPGVPVAAGATPRLKAPPWRATAESLGGVALPPIGATPRPDAQAVLAAALAAQEDGAVVVLGLGPLTNLRRLFAARPALVRKVKLLVLPGGPGERAWNVAADPAALRDLLTAGLRVAAVPEAAGRALALSSATLAQLAASPTPGAQLLAAIWRGAHHVPPLADAAVAAAVLGRAPAEKVRLSVTDTGTLRGGGGLAAQVLQPPPAEASRLLLALWLQAPPDQPEATRDGPLPLARVATFHGHLGPYVVIGYRAGLRARRLTGSVGYFDIESYPTTRGKPPEACFVDGVQLGTGATIGKGNLKPTAQAVPPRATFVAKNGRRVTMELAAGLYPSIAASIKRFGVGPTGLWAWSAPLDSLVRVVPPR